MKICCQPSVNAHDQQKKKMSDAEIVAVTKSRSPTIIITASGEVQTNEKATIYVEEFVKFLIMTALDNTSEVLSLGKLWNENGNFYEWINGQKFTSHERRDSDNLNCGKFRFYRHSILVIEFFSSSFHSSTSMTPSRKENCHPTGSPSSSIYPPQLC